MRSRTTKKEEKMNLLLRAFQEKDQLSVKEITELLTCSRKSAYNYINGLQHYGYAFYTQTCKNQTFYSLKESDPQVSPVLSYRPLTADILRKYTIIQVLQKGPVSRKDFRKQFIFPKSDKGDNNGYPLDISQSLFYKLVHQLIDDGDIIFNKDECHYYLTDAHIPYVLSLDADSLFDMHDKLSCISPGHPCYKQLHSIYQKEELLLGNPNEDTPYFDHYLIYGRSYQSSDHIRQQLALLEQYDYQHKLLEINYQTRRAAHVSTLFATGIIVFCLEKDTLYLLGKTVRAGSGPETSLCSIINMGRVQSITCTEKKHSCYHSDYFQSVFDAMFSISADPPVRVKVEFDAALEHRIIQLSIQRKKASIARDSRKNTLIYTDLISGLYDFANYLRQFGTHAKVLEPAKLKKIMELTVTRSLERYNEEI